MKTRIERNSGASGMLSALLAGRSDLIKQMTGDELVSNFIVLPEGPRTRRPATRFMGALKDETRPVQFIEFDAGPGDTYMLVVNGGVIRFYKDALLTTGSPTPTPYELAHDWTDDQIGNLFPAQSQDVIFIASGGKPKRLTRYADTHWALDECAQDSSEAVGGPGRVDDPCEAGAGRCADDGRGDGESAPVGARRW